VGRAGFQTIDPLDKLHHSRLEAHDASLELDERQAQHRLDLTLKPVNALLKALQTLLDAAHALLKALQSLLDAAHALLDAVEALHNLGLAFGKKLMPLSYDPDLTGQTFSYDVEVAFDLVHLVVRHPNPRQGSLG